MVLGIIGAVMGVVAAPTSAVAVPNGVVAVSTSEVGITQSVVGTQQQQQQQNGGDETGNTSDSGKDQDLANDPRLAKFALAVNCEANSPYAGQVHGKQVILRNGKLYLDDVAPERQHFPDGHPFTGFYLEYPFDQKQQSQPMGLVSTISREPPVLNWIYVDTGTLELRYGNKTQSKAHIVAPWDWTDDRSALTLDGWEGFMAVGDAEMPDEWVVRYDRDDDYLAGVRGSRPVVECSLRRMLL